MEKINTCPEASFSLRTQLCVIKTMKIQIWEKNCGKVRFLELIFKSSKKVNPSTFFYSTHIINMKHYLYQNYLKYISGRRDIDNINNKPANIFSKVYFLKTIPHVFGGVLFSKNILRTPEVYIKKSTFFKYVF